MTEYETGMDRPVIWIAEAWKDGDRIKRLAHVTKMGARRDIRQMTMFRDPDNIIVGIETLYLGDADEFHLTKDDIDE